MLTKFKHNAELVFSNNELVFVHIEDYTIVRDKYIWRVIDTTKDEGLGEFYSLHQAIEFIYQQD